MVQSPAMNEVRALFHRWINAWNNQDATGMASCVARDGLVIGFDGSKMTGPAEVESTLSAIFKDHQTARYVTIERKIRMLAPTVALFVADAGMVPRDDTAINPDVNARQTMLAVRTGDQWLIELIQNTPASLHGRRDIALALTEELKSVAKRIRPTHYDA